MAQVLVSFCHARMIHGAMIYDHDAGIVTEEVTSSGTAALTTAATVDARRKVVVTNAGTAPIGVALTAAEADVTLATAFVVPAGGQTLLAAPGAGYKLSVIDL